MSDSTETQTDAPQAPEAQDELIIDSGQSAETAETRSPDAGPEKASEASDELAQERPDELAPERVPYSRFAQQTRKLRETEAKLQELEAEIAKTEDIRKVFDEGWSWADDPIKFAKHDIKLLEGIDKLYRQNDPEVMSIIDRITKSTGGEMPDRKPAETTPAQPATDPRVEQLIQSQVQERANAVLERNNVRPELRGIILQGVNQRVKTPDESEVLSAVREVIAENKWNAEFLRGAEKAPARAEPKVEEPNQFEETAQAAPQKRQSTLSRHEQILAAREKLQKERDQLIREFSGKI